MTEQKTIQIQVNGQTMPSPPDLLIPAFLESVGLKPDRVIVEHNGRALTRSEAATVRLSDGDQLEVVRIVAGG